MKPKKSCLVALNPMDFELNGNYRVSTQCPHLYHKVIVEKFKNKFLVTIRFRSDYFKGVQKLLKFLEINRNRFEKRPLNDPSNPWQMVSDQLTASGFEDWSVLKTRQCFTCALDLYKKVRTKFLVLMS